MSRVLVVALIWVLLASRAVIAQQNVVWVQIEAADTLNAAQARARSYSAELPDVNGFVLTNGSYGISLGPYTRGDADQVLRAYRAEGVIPDDSFLIGANAFRQQFWPRGANLLNLPPVKPGQRDGQQDQVAEAEAEIETEVAAQTEAKPEVTQQAQVDTTMEPVEETPREARASEARLDAEERKVLQIALKWAGYYEYGIDGAIGPGTRAAMAEWQRNNGYEPTSILTTRQREQLLAQYNAVLEGLDLRMVRNDDAGIEMKLPMGVIEFDHLEPPFVHYTPSGEIPARVLLISQPGDRDTLFGLYDIMQTLEIVPPEGPRERGRDSFSLVGIGDEFISHTEANLQNGQIKGFTLVWPADDDARRGRLLREMQTSFARIDGVLDPGAGANTLQDVDLVSGLEVRKPRLTRSGFYIGRDGTVVTTTEVVQSCGRITLGEQAEARVVHSDPALGVAILKPVTPLTPMAVATLRATAPRLQSEVAVSGFSYGGVLGAPTMTFGKLADIDGLSGEENLSRLALTALPGDAGGPVVDAGGTVLGMLLPRQDGARKLPDDVQFAADAGAIAALLDGLDVTPDRADALPRIAPEDLTDRAAAMTVLVNCWE
ncbi:MAG: serine protease [Sediminimonas sp.]|uniref:serine protease n=1 Tax=Sediminimonas sp. TaxID=2823379 RepID=UPI0028701F4D|nr:serine protease [Sediminimonas sp.]MDR9484575.1 serine protease [Sediminimonas sp.]